MMKKTTMIAALALLCLLGSTAFAQASVDRSVAWEFVGHRNAADPTGNIANFEWIEAGWDKGTLGAFYFKSRAMGSGAVRNFGLWDTGLSFWTPAGTTLSYVDGATGAFIPGFDNSNNTSLGLDIKRFVATYTVKVCYVSNTVCDFAGAGSPESVLTASVGSTYRRTDGGAGTSYYVKESGTGNTGGGGEIEMRDEINLNGAVEPSPPRPRVPLPRAGAWPVQGRGAIRRPSSLTSPARPAYASPVRLPPSFRVPPST